MVFVGDYFLRDDVGGSGMNEKEKEQTGKEVSRRQFLTYTLMGIGSFLAVGLLGPMVRFAIDPALKAAGAGGTMVPVADISEITDVPKSVTFTVKQDDAWVKGQDATKTAWVYKNGEEVVALEPTCKHFGCMVNWAGDENHPDQFFCPCHLGRYTKDGVNVPNTPPNAPLDMFEYEVRDGKLYLGQLIKRT